MLEYRGKLQRAATTGNGEAIDLGGQCESIVAYITGTNGVSAGAVQLEEAPSPDYAGTWAAIGSPVAVPSDATVTIRAAVAGVLALRARISTTVADGTVDVEVVAHSGAGA